MTIGELILELQKYDSSGTVELAGADGSMGSDETGWMEGDAFCESIRKTDTGIILAAY